MVVRVPHIVVVNTSSLMSRLIVQCTGKDPSLTTHDPEDAHHKVSYAA